MKTVLSSVKEGEDGNEAGMVKSSLVVIWVFS